jgi:CNT family concentrative nucleoside transporter
MQNLVSFLGMLVLIFVAWLGSENRRRFPWRVVTWGLALQMLFGFLVLHWEPGAKFFLGLNDVFNALLSFSKQGATFVFNSIGSADAGDPSLSLKDYLTRLGQESNDPLVKSAVASGTVPGFFFAFQVLTTIIFFSALLSVLYYLGVMQKIVLLFARIMAKTMGVSGAESLSNAANIFVGQTEAPLVVRPYIDKMTRSELLLILTTGMATVASSTLGVYVAFLTGVFPQIAGHLISASILAIPASVVVSKLLIPETETPETLASVPPEDESTRSGNVISAIIQGAMDGLKLAAGISALLIAIMGIVALIDKLLGATSSWLGMSEPLSFVRILSWFFYPVAFLLGIKTSDVAVASRLLGERVILTEVFSYNHLAELVSSGQVTDPRTVVILSYALCGFAHVAAALLGAHARVHRALGEPDRALERGDHLGDRDRVGPTRERVAAAGSALRVQQALARERLQDLAHHRQRQLCAVRDVARVVLGLGRLLGEKGHQHDAVVGQARETDHGGPRENCVPKISDQFGPVNGDRTGPRSAAGLMACLNQ